mmetsp:Transcript_12583/g.42543  ORF Transcript_12583/g.42543 Transcript_12583/m.42543 type:complete len:244 (+) Transcript_12583:751-1482(+)
MAAVSPAKSRRARRRPACMATGVSSGRPSTTSPMAYTCGAPVCSPTGAATFPLDAFTSTPGSAPRPSWAVSAVRPIAARTVSNSPRPPSVKATAKAPLAADLSMDAGCTPRRMRTPRDSRCAATRSAQSRSNARSGTERTSTVTSRPRPARKPAHSRAMYEPPTHSVFPGAESSWNTSSDVMASSTAPGTSGGMCGRPPTAMTMCAAVARRVSPPSVYSRVCASTKDARALMYWTLADLSATR